MCIKIVVGRCQPTKNYRTIDFSFNENSSLPPLSKSIFLYLITKPENWVLNYQHLASCMGKSVQTVKKFLQPLVAQNYVFRLIKRDSKRRCEEWAYLVCETPQNVVDISNLLPPEWQIFRPEISMDKPTNEKAINRKANNSFLTPLIINKLLININSYSNFSSNNSYSKEKLERESQIRLTSHHRSSKLNRLTPIKSKLNRLPYQQPTLSDQVSVTGPDKHLSGAHPCLESSEEMDNQLIRQTQKSAPMKNKPKPVRGNEDLDDIISLWAELGFRPLVKDRAIKTYNRTVWALKKLMGGRLIPGETRKFSLEDIRQGMTAFGLLIFNPEYQIRNTGQREALSKIPLKDFLYNTNPRTTSKIESWFIRVLDNPPQVAGPTEQLVEDRHPEITERLKKFFNAYVVCGIPRKNWKTGEENKFREASNKICEVFDKKRDMIHVRGYGEMADLLCESIKQYYGDRVTKIFPGSFCSPFAMTRMMAYAKEMGYISG